MHSDDAMALLALVWGRTIALELLLRGLWTERCLQAADPQRALFEAIESLVASVDIIRRPEEAGLVEIVEHELRDFAANVRTRLENIARDA